MPESCRKRTPLFTLPNCLSLSRIALVPPIAWAIVNGAGPAAVTLFCLAVLTDVIDGRIARHSRQATRLGTLLDHGSDAIFVTSLSAVCAGFGLLPPPLPILIAVAFIQYLLDSSVPVGSQLRRSDLGRWNGIAYFVAVGLAIVAHHYVTDESFVSTVRGFGWFLSGSTLVSIAGRAVRSLRSSPAP